MPEARRKASADDRHGEAALVLVESLIHGLLEKSVFTRRDLIDIIEGAIDVLAEIEEEQGDDPEPGSLGRVALLSIAKSFMVDDRRNSFDIGEGTY